jgi:hypothetical protein
MTENIALGGLCKTQQKYMFKHELGKRAKDKITGFEGVITARCEFLTGCSRYCIQPTALKDGKPIESIYFDEDQIEIIGSGIKQSEVTGAKRGNCSPDPVK